MLRFVLRLILISVLAVVLWFGISRWAASAITARYRYAAQDVPERSVAIVFGAGLQRNGRPSAVLRDRVEVAAELYAAGKVDVLLVSGDNRFVDYNEPRAMQQYAIELGVLPEDIVLDYAGQRTYDTCYRARFIFGIEEATLVTQSFHLPRALLTCGGLGIDAVGVGADVRQYGRRSYTYWNLREIPATAVAVWEVWVARPLPILGQPEYIFFN